MFVYLHVPFYLIRHPTVLFGHTLFRWFVSSYHWRNSVASSLWAHEDDGSDLDSYMPCHLYWVAYTALPLTIPLPLTPILAPSGAAAVAKHKQLVFFLRVLNTRGP